MDYYNKQIESFNVMMKSSSMSVFFQRAGGGCEPVKALYEWTSEHLAEPFIGVGVNGSRPIIVVESECSYNEWVYFLTNEGGITGLPVLYQDRKAFFYI